MNTVFWISINNSRTVEQKFECQLFRLLYVKAFGSSTGTMALAFRKFYFIVQNIRLRVYQRTKGVANLMAVSIIRIVICQNFDFFQFAFSHYRSPFAWIKSITCSIHCRIKPSLSSSFTEAFVPAAACPPDSGWLTVTFICSSLISNGIILQ